MNIKRYLRPQLIKDNLKEWMALEGTWKMFSFSD